jgi:hypothetical protein
MEVGDETELVVRANDGEGVDPRREGNSLRRHGSGSDEGASDVLVVVATEAETAFCKSYGEDERKSEKVGLMSQRFPTIQSSNM